MAMYFSKKQKQKNKTATTIAKKKKTKTKQNIVTSATIYRTRKSLPK
jgi:uncharacterized lipoprotein YbaY